MSEYLLLAIQNHCSSKAYNNWLLTDYS